MLVPRNRLRVFLCPRPVPPPLKLPQSLPKSSNLSTRLYSPGEVLPGVHPDFSCCDTERTGEKRGAGERKEPERKRALGREIQGEGGNPRAARKRAMLTTCSPGAAPSVGVTSTVVSILNWKSFVNFQAASKAPNPPSRSAEGEGRKRRKGGSHERISVQSTHSTHPGHMPPTRRCARFSQHGQSFLHRLCQPSSHQTGRFVDILPETHHSHTHTNTG